MSVFNFKNNFEILAGLLIVVVIFSIYTNPPL
jgi:hypothetical protein